MISETEFRRLLPLACEWVQEQEKIIINNGVSLNDDQQIDAWLTGVKEISKVRLLKVKQIPVPTMPELKSIVKKTGIITPSTIGITFRYGIYIRSDFWGKRGLIVHELAHTMQYERMGSIDIFLSQYLEECIQLGYPNGPLEQEAIAIEKRIINT